MGDRHPGVRDRVPCRVLRVRHLLIIPWTTSHLDEPNDLRFRESVFHDRLMFEEQGVCACGVRYRSPAPCQALQTDMSQLSGAMGHGLMAPSLCLVAASWLPLKPLHLIYLENPECPPSHALDALCTELDLAWGSPSSLKSAPPSLLLPTPTLPPASSLRLVHFQAPSLILFSK